jgi:hypothetical protein
VAGSTDRLNVIAFVTGAPVTVKVPLAGEG